MSTLPPNATPLERGVDHAAARITEIPAAVIATLWDPERCPEPLLPWLAWALGVDRWDESWPEPVKREAIRLSRRRHELRGTWAAVKAELDLIGAVYDVAEGPAAMTGSVTIHNGDSIRVSGLAPLRERLDAVKRASFHLAINFRSGISGDIAFAAGMVPITPRKDRSSVN